VIAAALTLSLPIQGSEWNSVFIVEDQPVPERAHLPNAAFTPISTGYFQTLGIQLLAGRMFNEADNEDTPQVVIINETAARHFWPDQQALGKRLKQGFPESTAPWREVIGVVADVKLEGLAQQTPMQIYLPVAQNSTSSFNLVARTETEPTTMASSIQAVIHTIDPDLPVYQIRSMNQVLERSIMTRRATMILLGGFATLAVVLAAVGIYGVISYGVIQRTREIGLRMALGAEPGQVMRLILRQGMSLILAGVSVGLIGAFALTRVISSMLFEVSATDPITFVGVPFVLTAIALLACYLPARRAMRVDPMAALRCE
jgi:putative ABC transport system permease protein